MFQLNPLTRKKLARFRSIKRGYWSFLILVFLYLISLAGELFVNNRALLVSYNNEILDALMDSKDSNFVNTEYLL